MGENIWFKSKLIKAVHLNISFECFPSTPLQPLFENEEILFFTNKYVFPHDAFASSFCYLTLLSAYGLWEIFMTNKIESQTPSKEFMTNFNKTWIRMFRMSIAKTIDVLRWRSEERLIWVKWKEQIRYESRRETSCLGISLLKTSNPGHASANFQMTSNSSLHEIILSTIPKTLED